MKLYITAAGDYVRTQEEAKAAGKGWRKVDVPTDSHGLPAYLNSVREKTERLPAPPVAAAAQEEPTPVPEDVCGMCKRNRRGQDVLAEGRDLDDIAKRIHAADGWHLDRLITAVTSRLDELRRGLS